MTMLHIFGLVCLALAPILATAAYYLHKDSLRHRRATGRYVLCSSCDRFRPVSQAREVRRPVTVPGRPAGIRADVDVRGLRTRKEAA